MGENMKVSVCPAGSAACHGRRGYRLRHRRHHASRVCQNPRPHGLCLGLADGQHAQSQHSDFAGAGARMK